MTPASRYKRRRKGEGREEEEEDSSFRKEPRRPAVEAPS
jgi:hypothetical protein